MRIRLNHHSGEPIYRQIVESIKYAVACGQLAEDEKLPSIRSLASSLKINPRTVVKAYEELEKSGLVIMKHGQGVFVTPSGGKAPATARRKAITELARRMMAEATGLGAATEETLEIIRQVAEEMRSKD